MIPLFKRVWFLLWYDELSAVRWLRGFLSGCGAMFITISGKITGKWSEVLGIAGIVLVSLSTMVTAGQKNPELATAKEGAGK